jgi:hypothetical protein
MNVNTSILRHEEPVGFGVPLQMWTRVSSDTSSQLASEGRDQCAHEYPPTRAASWLRRAVTNEDKDYPPTRTASWLRRAVTNEDKDYPPTRAASWLWRAVTNVATIILRQEEPVRFGGP